MRNVHDQFVKYANFSKLEVQYTCYFYSLQKLFQRILNPKGTV